MSELKIDETQAWARLFRLLPGLAIKANTVVAMYGFINYAWSLSALADEVEALQGQVRTLNEQVETLTIQNNGLVRTAALLMGKGTKVKG